MVQDLLYELAGSMNPLSLTEGGSARGSLRVGFTWSSQIHRIEKATALIPRILGTLNLKPDILAPPLFLEYGKLFRMHAY